MTTIFQQVVEEILQQPVAELQAIANKEVTIRQQVVGKLEKKGIK